MREIINHGTLYENGDTVTVICKVCSCQYVQPIRELDKILIGLPEKRVIVSSYSECPECGYKNRLVLLRKEPASLTIKFEKETNDND